MSTWEKIDDFICERLNVKLMLNLVEQHKLQKYEFYTF